MSVSIGTTGASGTAADIILSIRDQIPDMVEDASQDGSAFSLATLLRWLNDAGRIMCATAAVLQDWYGITSAAGMDVYELPQYIVSVDQAWYDLTPLTRSAELDDIFVNKIQGRSWWFGPHSIHATPRLHVWPACDRTGLSTTLAAPMTAAATTLTLTSITGLKDFGFLRVDNELILYRTVNSSTKVVSNILRAQGGTVLSDHLNGATVNEANIFFKCNRLPNPLTSATSLIEVPQGLWPLLELYVLAKVREAEQEMQAAQGLRQEFTAQVEKLAEKSQLKGLKQGLQVRLSPPGLQLYGGRVYIP